MKKITTYEGSYRDILKLSLPLILTWLSTTIMMFADRLFLSHYSLEALGAAVIAGTYGWGIAYGFQIFAEMSQVVIAQYRGAGKDQKLSAPVWQMLWIVLASIFFYLPMAIYGSKLFFIAGSLQSQYFMWFLFFGPAFGLIGACSAYFIGKGENRVVTITAVIGNLVNLVLDYFMIFGIKGVLDPMGAKGAAIATGIGATVQGLLLLILFLRHTNFKVLPFRFSELKPCLRVGIPPSIFMSFELIGWGVFFSLMAKSGYVHLTVTSICHSLLPLLACVGIGMQKAVSTVTGYWIGERKMDGIPQLVQKAIIILGLYFLVLVSIMFLFPDLIIGLFQNKKLSSDIHGILQTGLFLSVTYLFFGGIRNIITGILSAAGDSFFLTIFGSLSVWLFLLVPTYFFVTLSGTSVTFAQSILVCYGVFLAAIYLIRYKIGNWASRASLVA